MRSGHKGRFQEGRKGQSRERQQLAEINWLCVDTPCQTITHGGFTSSCPRLLPFLCPTFPPFVPLPPLRHPSVYSTSEFHLTYNTEPVSPPLLSPPFPPPHLHQPAHHLAAVLARLLPLGHPLPAPPAHRHVPTLRPRQVAPRSTARRAAGGAPHRLRRRAGRSRGRGTCRSSGSCSSVPTGASSYTRRRAGRLAGGQACLSGRLSAGNSSASSSTRGLQGCGTARCCLWCGL